MFTKGHQAEPFQAESGNYVNAAKANMNASEAAQWLGIGERTLRDLTMKREIRSVKIGKRRLWRKKDLEAFLDSQTV